MIYADYNATCPSKTSHLSDVMQILRGAEGNPSSIHQFGRRSKAILEESRQNIAQILGASSDQIIFTSGATEANNMMIASILGDNEPQHIVLTKTEHPSVINPITVRQKKNLCRASFISVDKDAIINQKDLFDTIDENTKCICLIHVNNEVGAINPVEDISKKIKNKYPNIHIHVDAVQALGKIYLTWLGKSQIDSASFSAHKIGGLKGCGCLYLKSPQKHHMSFMLGGGQEEGKRAGTENLAGIISFGIIAKDIFRDPQWMNPAKVLRSYLINQIQSLDHVHIHGDPDKIIYNTINLHVDKVDLQTLLLKFEHQGIAISSKSACSSGISQASYVLQAMGYSEEIAKNSVRISLGYNNTKKDMERIVKLLASLRSKK